MNDIQERIKRVKPYFKEMQVTQVEDVSVIYVVVSFPEKWIIDDSAEEKFAVAVRDGQEPGDYYFCAEMEVGFDKVFDAIDHCIGVNKDAMERAQIFQEKLKELKEIFANGTNSISELKTLEFTFPPQKKGKKETKPKKQPPIDEIYDEESKM